MANEEMLAGLFEGLLTGAAAGLKTKAEREKYEKEQASKREQQQFENEMKLIDAADKMQSIEQKKYQNLMVKDLLRAAGLDSGTPGQNMIGREVAGANLGDGKMPSYSNTLGGRTNKLIDDKGFANLDREITLSPTGISIKLSEKDRKKMGRTASDQDKVNEYIIKLATEMADREYLERMALEKDSMGMPLYRPGIHNPSQFRAPQHLIDAWIPYATDMAHGAFGSAKNKADARRGEQDPLARTPAKAPGLFDLMIQGTKSAAGRLMGRD